MRTPLTKGQKAMSEAGKDIYRRVTDQIVAELEKGVRPWLKPWNADHAAGRITRPLRANGIPYRGINVLMLWSDAGQSRAMKNATAFQSYENRSALFHSTATRSGDKLHSGRFLCGRFYLQFYWLRFRLSWISQHGSSPRTLKTM
jgi:hypothetical protein